MMSWSLFLPEQFDRQLTLNLEALTISLRSRILSIWITYSLNGRPSPSDETNAADRKGSQDKQPGHLLEASNRCLAEDHHELGDLLRLDACVETRIDQVIVGPNESSLCPSLQDDVVGDRKLLEIPTKDPATLTCRGE